MNESKKPSGEIRAKLIYDEIVNIIKEIDKIEEKKLLAMMSFKHGYKMKTLKKYVDSLVYAEIVYRTMDNRGNIFLTSAVK